jgi:hypothetical protein
MARKIRTRPNEIKPLPVRVKVHGPNLTVQSKGQFHVHTSNCQDNKHYGPDRKFGGEDSGWLMTVGSRREIVETIYADHMAEHENPDWQNYDDLYLAPCVQFGTARIDPALARKELAAVGINPDAMPKIVRPAKSAKTRNTGVPAPSKSLIRWTRIAKSHYVLGRLTIKHHGPGGRGGAGHWLLTDSSNGSTNQIGGEFISLRDAKNAALQHKIKESA